MPTILRVGPFRFFFYAGDGDEPPHVHVEGEGNTAKFWLDPVKIQDSGRFHNADLNWVERIIQENQAVLIGGWDEFFKE